MHGAGRVKCTFKQVQILYVTTPILTTQKHGIKILIQSQIQIAWKIASKLIFVEFKFHTTYAYKNNWSFHLKDFLAS